MLDWMVSNRMSLIKEGPEFELKIATSDPRSIPNFPSYSFKNIAAIAVV